MTSQEKHKIIALFCYVSISYPSTPSISFRVISSTLASLVIIAAFVFV